MESYSFVTILAGEVCMACWIRVAFLIAALAGAARAAESAPPTAEQKAAIEKSIAKLGDDSFEAREEAKLELLKIGDAAVAQLSKTKSETTDAEVRGSVEKLLTVLNNPLRKAKVGDWMLLAVNVDTGKIIRSFESKQVVTHVTETDITLETTSKMGERNPRTQSQVVKFSEPYSFMQASQGAANKELATGNEKLSINGKEVDTKWVEFEQTLESNGKEIVSKCKIWTNTELVPLSGIVKFERDGEGKMSMELKDYGRGK